MDVVEDTRKHIDLVASLLDDVTMELMNRGNGHDASKLQSPEREMYEIYRPKLDAMDIQSEEYKTTLREMGEGLKHHYAANRHHPEHFDNGIRGMNLIDVIEMVCDWKAAAARTGKPIDIEWARGRFGSQDDGLLFDVIKNTIDFWDNKQQLAQAQTVMEF